MSNEKVPVIANNVPLTATSPPPERPGADDVALILAKAIVSAVPIAGGPAGELLDLLRLPVQKRQYQWLSDLAERLRRLESEGRLRIEELPENDAFVSAIVVALDAVKRTGDKEKRAALRNAILNVVLDQTPDETLQQIMLGLVDRLTAWHLRLLKAMDNPFAWAQAKSVNYQPAMTSSLDAFIEAAFPELRERKGFYGLLWAELGQAGLAAGSLSTMMTDRGWQSSRTTEFGKQLLRFISEPQAVSGA